MRISDWSSDVCSSDLMTAYSGIVSYQPSELVVTARAGTSLAALEAALAEHGQMLAFEPPHFSSQAPVGGRSAERRVGKESVSTCDSTWAPHPEKKKHKTTTSQENVS